MKKLFLILLVLATLAGFSQKNVVKLGISNITIGDISLKYERQIAKRITLNATVGYWDLNTASMSIVNSTSTGDGIWITDFGKGFHSSLECRFYLTGEESIKGFYLGPYFRYWQNEIYLADKISNDQIKNVPFDIDAKLNGIGAGVQIGYQWIIRDRLSIDWYFIGLGAERYNVNAVYTTKQFDNFDYSIIEADVLEPFTDPGVPGFISNNVDVFETKNNLSVDIPFWMVGIKTGFAIGIAF